METFDTQGSTAYPMDFLPVHNNTSTPKRVAMGHRVCDNCGDDKDTSGGKTCSKGHFLCHSCASRHEHCPLCGHTLR